MAPPLLTLSGPWCGALNHTSVVMRARVKNEVTTARVTVVEGDNLKDSNAKRRTYPASWPPIDLGKYEGKVVWFHAEELKPDQQYTFILELNGRQNAALPGRFRTAPPEGSASSFSFVCSACAHPGYFPCRPLIRTPYEVLSKMNAETVPVSERPLFFCYLGDFHYANIVTPDVPKRIAAYAGKLQREEIGAVFRDLPIAYCWDDHDFLGDGSAGKGSNTTVLESARNAYDAFVPHYPFESPVSTNEGIYQSFKIGRVQFLLTDTRYFRSPKVDEDTPQKTMLGPEQKKWLMRKLDEGTDLDLTVWMNSVPWIARKEAGQDNWGGYTCEREELARFIHDRNIRNICMLSGDAHMVAIDDGTWKGVLAGRRGGFPVFQTASLESWAPKPKGGPYSVGKEDGTEGDGVEGRRQFGVCKVEYRGNDAVPHITWTAFRVKEDSAEFEPPPIPPFTFRGRETYGRFFERTTEW